MSKRVKVHRYLSKDGTVRVASVVATSLIEEMRTKQNTFPLATVALGRALLGSVLMASHGKEQERVGLHFQGNGPLKNLFAEASHEGACRAYVAEPQTELPAVNGLMDVSGGIGIGLLNVVQSHPKMSQPYSGTVQIITGEIGDDIAYYLSQSLQIPSVVALAVRLDRTGKVESAGGILIEAMPGVEDVTLELLEKNVKAAQPLSDAILSGTRPEDLFKEYVKGIDVEELDHPYFVNYHCHCNKERVYRSLILLGHQEIDTMIEEKEKAEIECNFCGKKYLLTVDELKTIRSTSYKNSLN